jgi:hypothetical protein
MADDRASGRASFARRYTYSVWFEFQSRAEAIGRAARKYNRINPVAQINRGLAHRHRMPRVIRREHQPKPSLVADSEITVMPVGLLS